MGLLLDDKSHDGGKYKHEEQKEEHHGVQNGPKLRLYEVYEVSPFLLSLCFDVRYTSRLRAVTLEAAQKIVHFVLLQIHKRERRRRRLVFSLCKLLKGLSSRIASDLLLVQLMPVCTAAVHATCLLHGLFKYYTTGIKVLTVQDPDLERDFERDFGRQSDWTLEAPERLSIVFCMLVSTSQLRSPALDLPARVSFAIVKRQPVERQL